jgi:CBS-domain-containing membrane protein
MFADERLPIDELSGSDAVVAEDARGTRTDDVDGLTVADVMHAEVVSMPATVTVGELRDWFSTSTSRRLAVITADGCYAGALTPADVGGEVPADRPALEVARVHPTIAPAMPAATGRDLAIATGARRVPVVDEQRRFRGVLAVTTDLRFFACRPMPAPD